RSRSARVTMASFLLRDKHGRRRGSRSNGELRRLKQVPSIPLSLSASQAAGISAPLLMLPLYGRVVTMPSANAGRKRHEADERRLARLGVCQGRGGGGECGSEAWMRREAMRSGALPLLGAP